MIVRAANVRSTLNSRYIGEAPKAIAASRTAPGTCCSPSTVIHTTGGEPKIKVATIAAGLSADDALRATTVTPAALLGISAVVGTIEVGKLANLVVVSGNDLFAANTPLKHVFVDGRIY